MYKNMSSNKKISLVTGANRGIGLSICKMFVRNGYFVIGSSRTENGVNTINSYVKNNGIGYILDLTNYESIKRVVLDIKKSFGGVDILINNAGVIDDDLMCKMSQSKWNNVIETNLTSVFNLSKLLIGHMIKQRYGRIISISSLIASTGNIGQVNYAASKAGIIGFSKSLAREVASRGITVNVVSPGFIKSDMTNFLSDEYKSKILKNIPLGRFGCADDIASAVSFLASDKSSYITGETLHVNGGIYMV